MYSLIFFYRSTGSPTCPANQNGIKSWEYLSENRWVPVSNTVTCKAHFPRQYSEEEVAQVFQLMNMD